MFQHEQSGRRSWWRSFGGSMALHLALAALLLAPAAPIFIKSRPVQKGDRGEDTVTFLARRSELEYQPQTVSDSLTFKTAQAKRAQKKKPKSKVNEPSKDDSQRAALRAGQTYGSYYSGMIDGIEVKPALPKVYPDPPVSRDELVGVTGDVIVEVTIDTTGTVTGTRLLSGLSDGIDEKVLATVKNWHFTPATWAGRPVASKHDVHFHFPA